jgi:hypothetical protein
MTNLTYLNLQFVKHYPLASLVTCLTKLQHLRLPKLSVVHGFISNLTNLRIVEVDELGEHVLLPQSVTKLKVYRNCYATLPSTLRALHFILNNVGSHEELSTLTQLTKLTLWMGSECKSQVTNLLPKFTQLRQLTLGPRPHFSEEDVTLSSLHFLSQLTNLNSLVLALPASNSQPLNALSCSLTRLVLHTYRGVSFELFSRLQYFGVCLQSRDIFTQLQNLPHAHTLAVLLTTRGLTVESLFDLEHLTHITKLVFIGWKSPTLWFSSRTVPCPTRLCNLIYNAKIVSWT